jgi:hypothetical protein
MSATASSGEKRRLGSSGGVDAELADDGRVWDFADDFLPIGFSFYCAQAFG